MLRSISQRSIKLSTSVAPFASSLSHLRPSREYSSTLATGVALRCTFREFHHKTEEESSKPIEFDNGKKVEKWSFGHGAHDPPGPSSFTPFPSALEAEVHLPTAQQLYETIPSAEEAERMAKASQQTSEDEAEHKDGDEE